MWSFVGSSRWPIRYWVVVCVVYFGIMVDLPNDFKAGLQVGLPRGLPGGLPGVLVHGQLSGIPSVY